MCSPLSRQGSGADIATNTKSEIRLPVFLYSTTSVPLQLPWGYQAQQDNLVVVLCDTRYTMSWVFTIYICAVCIILGIVMVVIWCFSCSSGFYVPTDKNTVLNSTNICNLHSTYFTFLICIAKYDASVMARLRRTCMCIATILSTSSTILTCTYYVAGYNI